MCENLEKLLRASTCKNAVWIDDNRLAFLKRGGDAPAVWEINVNTLEAKQRTFGNENITSITAHPETGGILFTMDEGGNENYQIYLLKRDEDKPSALTGELNARHMLGGLTSDGKTLVYTSNERTEETFDVWKKDIETGKEEMVIKLNDHYNWPPYEALSPDGRYVLYNKLRGQSDNGLWIGDIENKTAARVPADDIVSAETLPAWKNNSAGFYLVSDRAEEFPFIAYYDVNTKELKKVLEFGCDIEALALSSDDRYLAATMNEKGYIALHIFDIENNYAEVNCPQLPKGVVSYYGTLSWSGKGHKMLVSLTSGKRPENIWLIDIDEESVRPLTHTDIDTSDLSEPVLMSFESFDGLTVPYWLYVPTGYSAENLPVVVEIHGGPEGQETASFTPFIQYLLSEGIAVAAPNVRGSTGYGKTYTHLDDVEKRLDSVKDIDFLVRHLIEKGIADEKRIAVTGMSYGGFMTLSCVTRLPKLWACAIDIMGMYNLESFLENTAKYRRVHRESEYGSLEKHRDILRQVSPVDKIDDIEAPLMVVQGRNDPRVPAEEAEQVVNTLRSKGHRVEYLCYEDEGHGINKLKNQLDCYYKMAKFLNKYLNK